MNNKFLYALACIKLSQSSTKTLEINLIVYNSILSPLLLLCFILIKWKNISFINIIFFLFIFIITITNLVFSSLLRHWRKNNLIKTIKKVKGIVLAKIGFGLAITLLIFTIIEEFIFVYSYSDRHKKIGAEEYLISYLTFSFLEIFSILGICIWKLLIDRIIRGLDYPGLAPNIISINTGPVVMVPPGGIIYTDTQRNTLMPITTDNNQNNNQYNYKYNNIVEKPQNIPNQIQQPKSKYSKSNTTTTKYFKSNTTTTKYSK